MSLQQKAEQLFNNPLIPDALNEYNRSAWVKAMEYLGDKHILYSKVDRKELK